MLFVASMNDGNDGNDVDKNDDFVSSGFMNRGDGVGETMSEDGAIPNLHIGHGSNGLSSNGSLDPQVQNCSGPLDNVHFEDPLVVGSLIPLGLVCLVVILGNMMVIIAVFNTHKLRGATYLFIVSLACADLMLGLVILPFSAMYEVFSLWLFGSIWCSIWLAVDVWMCTASILHLVVISLDRYIAVTHPITYPNIMTSKRAKMLICGAWILSFVICFPPLVGWNDQRQTAIDGQGFDSDPVKTETDPCRPQCVLNQEPGYVIYSAVGSFYAPMLVMMFFNWRIYRTARKTTRAIRQGWTKVKGVGGDDEIGMGIHRGGSHSSSDKKTSTVVSSNGMVGTKISSGSTRSTNGVTVTVVKGGNGLPTPGSKSGSSTNKSSTSAAVKNGGSSNGLKPRMNSIPRSASCQMVNKEESNHRVTTERSVTLTVSEKSLLSPNGSARGRSKSVALAGRPQAGNYLTVPNAHEYNGAKSGQSEDEEDDPTPRLSQHQPCPNHVAGKTFSERGTQTLAKQKAEQASSSGDSSTSTRRGIIRRGCLAIRCPSKSRDDELSSEAEEATKPLRLSTRLKNGKSSLDVEHSSRGFESSWRRSKSQGDEDVVSVGSAHGHRNSSGKAVTCFECHPRRWRHRTPKMFDVFVLKRYRQKRRRHSSSIGGGSGRINLETPSLLNLSLPGSTDELRSMGGVAAMIGSVVNHSAHLAVAAGGVQAAAAKNNKTFGRRNIKNQVRRFRVETKAAKTLGIIVGCFIVCWFPFFTMYLVTAFCEDCIPPLVFSIFFWLGYCNSAINPFIYAMFSREFRGAFKKILCRLFCKKVNDEPNRRGVFMAFHGAATAAAVVTAAGARNVAAVSATTGKNTNCIFNSEAGSGGGGGGFHSTVSQGSRRNSAMVNK